MASTPQSRSGWYRWGLTLLFQLIGAGLGVSIGVTYALGQYEERFRTIVAKVEAGEKEREEIIEKIDQAVLLNSSKGEIIAGNTKDINRLNDDFDKLESSSERDLKELKEDLNKQLNRMETNLSNQISGLMYVIENTRKEP